VLGGGSRRHHCRRHKSPEDEIGGGDGELDEEGAAAQGRTGCWTNRWASR
jgi:hypothetical protein